MDEEKLAYCLEDIFFNLINEHGNLFSYCEIDDLIWNGRNEYVSIRKRPFEEVYQIYRNTLKLYREREKYEPYYIFADD